MSPNCKFAKNSRTLFIIAIFLGGLIFGMRNACIKNLSCSQTRGITLVRSLEIPELPSPGASAENGKPSYKIPNITFSAIINCGNRFFGSRNSMGEASKLRGAQMQYICLTSEFKNCEILYNVNK